MLSLLLLKARQGEKTGREAKAKARSARRDIDLDNNSHLTDTKNTSHQDAPVRANEMEWREV